MVKDEDRAETPIFGAEHAERTAAQAFGGNKTGLTAKSFRLRL